MNHSGREESILRAQKFSTVLSSAPMTAAEINTALGESYTPLQISNAVKFISGGSATRVVRTVRSAKGLLAEKEYAAYYLDEDDQRSRQRNSR